MPVITVRQVAGRSMEQKRELAKRITDVVHEVNGTAPEHIHVIIDEVPDGHWLHGYEVVALPRPEPRS